MSTLNFKDVENFPLMVMSDLEVCEAFWGTEDEDGNPITEYDEEQSRLAYDELFFDDECMNGMTFNDTIEELNNKLLWYKVSTEYGYYDGIQIYVDTEWLPLNEWSDEDSRDEFDMTKAELVEQIALERETILKFMEQSKVLGFRELLHLGTFSNGEGVYKYKDEII